ncbi:MAG: hypothetical protein IPP97_17260 [Candidatus Obscuribacter sp.]|nr:hypothetical protein [Candidatus Obscuribacter sp.]
MMLAASSAAILPVFRSIGSEQTQIRLRTACESATDYIVAKLNRTDTRPSVDCGSVYGASKNIVISPTLLGLSVNDYSVSAVMKNTMPEVTDNTDVNSSFDPQLFYHPSSPLNISAIPDEQKTSSKKWSLFTDVNGGNPWRVVVVTVAASGGLKKTLTTVLRPVVPANAVVGGSNQFFSSAVLGLDGIYLGNGAKTMSFSDLNNPDSFSKGTIDPLGPQYNIGADLNSKGFVKLAAGSEIGGAVNVEGQNSSDFSATNLGGIVNQTLKYSVNQKDFTYTAPNDPGNNVLNATPNGTPESSPLAQNDGTVTPIPPALSSPVDSSGGSTANNAGQLAVTTPQTIANDVNATSVSIGTGASLSVSNPSRIFIESGPNNFVGDGTNEPTSFNVVDIHGSANKLSNGNPGDPSRLQIWYNGSGNINIDGSAISATIYAPNANVTIKNSVFYGSIVARNIAGAYDSNGNPIAPVTNTEFRFFDPLKSSSGPSYDPSDFTNVTSWRVDSVFE